MRKITRGVEKMTIKVIKPEVLYNEFHLEHEQKPVVEPTTKTSEDVHGGDEITQSMQDQRFAQQQTEEQQNNQPQCNNIQLNYQQTNDSSTQAEQQHVQQNGTTEDNNETNQQQTQQKTEQQTENHQNNETQQQNQNVSSQLDDKQTEQQNNNDDSQQDESQSNNENQQNDQSQNNSDSRQNQQTTEQQQNNTQQTNENQQNDQSQNNQQQNELQNNNDQQSETNQQQSEQQTNESQQTTEQQSGTNQNDETEEQTLDDSVSDDYQEQEVEEQEDDYDEEDDYYDYDEEQEDTPEYNTQQAFKINEEHNVKRQLYLAFYRLVEYLSDEEKQPTLLPGQTLVLNVKKLMMRQYERKPLNAYYYYRTRSQVVLMLDNSGSMEWLIDELSTFFEAALKRKDVQIYVAPNGHIEEYYNDKTKLFELIDHDYAIRQIIRSGLPVIYVGDFDGANTPIELSWTNRVYWICTETRYKYFSHHDWVGRCLKEDAFGNCEDFRPYHEDDFKGFFGRAFNDKEIITVLKEFVKNVYKQRFWYDKHDIEDFSEE
jgi:chemotaxis protein histidine kinase CheA